MMGWSHRGARCGLIELSPGRPPAPASFWRWTGGVCAAVRVKGPVVAAPTAVVSGVRPGSPGSVDSPCPGAAVPPRAVEPNAPPCAIAPPGSAQAGTSSAVPLGPAPAGDVAAVLPAVGPAPPVAAVPKAAAPARDPA